MIFEIIRLNSKTHFKKPFFLYFEPFHALLASKFKKVLLLPLKGSQKFNIGSKKYTEYSVFGSFDKRLLEEN
jgi:hypothetical protein